ncbi:MAG: response regulator [Bacteroidota bacterium]
MDEKYRFLFVDDSELDNSYVEMMIRIEGLPIDPLFIRDARLALEYLANVEEQAFPQILVVDINMPLMDGFEFVQRYEELYCAKFPQSKVYMTSSTRRMSEISRAKQVQIVEDFIEKPISPLFISEKVFPMILLNKID